MQYKFEDFKNIGIITKKFSKTELLPIMEEIEEIHADFSSGIKYNVNLAGNIKKEFLLVKTHNYVETLITPMIEMHNREYTYLKDINVLSKDALIKLSKTWVNFQKKHEFNPIHNHTGILSFVIWVKVPYKIIDEQCVFPDTKNKTAGCFQFVYTDTLGKVNTRNIEADFSYEGVAIIFPAGLSHCVYPFYTSDEYRISVSGNFVYDIA